MENKDKNFLETLQEENLLDLFIVSCISADSLFSVEDCDESLTALKDALNDIETANIERKDFYKKLIVDGIQIVERDRQMFLNEQNETNTSDEQNE
jgi:hypothetical protein